MHSAGFADQAEVLHAITPVAAPPAGVVSSASASAPAVAGDSIATRLSQGLEAARVLEHDARDAVRALQAHERSDVEGVLLATRKADAAFQMLQAVRNAMLDAYAEIRDMRV